MTSVTTEKTFINSFKTGLSDGIPIALGYLSVSFTFGIMASAGKLPAVIAVLISMTNLTSAGQFAGLQLILGGGSLVEMALTQLVINLRYALMSISLSQKMHKSVTFADRLWIAFGNTDEIFAVASAKPGEVGKKYMIGLILLPFFGWSGGTLLGAVAGSILPETLTSALGIAIYGMFLAIFIPAMKKSRPITVVVLVSVALSCAFAYLPGLKNVSSGFVIILCALAASAVGAVLAPIDPDAPQEAHEKQKEGDAV